MTKIKHIHTGKNRIAIVDMPEGAREPFIGPFLGNLGYYIMNTKEQHGAAFFIELSTGNWSILGPLKDLTEDQAAEMVDEGSYTTTFKNYVTNDRHKSNQCRTALESVETLLQISNIYTENPFEKPIIPEDETWVPPIVNELYKQWAEAEQHVYKNALILINNDVHTVRIRTNPA